MGHLPCRTIVIEYLILLVVRDQVVLDDTLIDSCWLDGLGILLNLFLLLELLLDVVAQLFPLLHLL